SPMQINFHYEIGSAPDDDPIVPNHLGYTQCNAAPSSYSQYACSCTDCSLMCPKPKPIPGDPSEWKLFGISGVSVLMIVVYCRLLSGSIVSSLIYNRYMRKDNDDGSTVMAEQDKLDPESERRKEHDQRAMINDTMRQSFVHEKICLLFGW